MTTQADTTLIYQDYFQGKPQTKTTIYINDNTVRLEEKQNGTYTLFNTQQSIIYSVDTNKEQYTITDIDSTRKSVKEMLIMQQQLKEQLKQHIEQLPIQQQQLARKYLQQTEALMNLQVPTPEHQVVNELKNINGLACRVTLSTVKNYPIREICNASDNIMAEQDFENFLRLLRFMDNLDRESAQLQHKPPPTEGTAEIHEAGLAIRIKTLPDESVTELIAIRQDLLDETLFTIPSHYQLIDPFQITEQQSSDVILEKPFRASSFNP